MAVEEPRVARPIPVPDDLSRPYWEAAARHELVLPRCAQCGALVLPPVVPCPGCGHGDPAYDFVAVSGRGHVQSWTRLRQAFLPGFEADLPFLLVDVQLDDAPGVRMIGRLLDGPDAPLRIGAAVSVGFEDIAPKVAVPAFRLART
jgi:uncharacterized OB-fold protein